MTYGISGNRHKGAHLTLSKKPKPKVEKEAESLFEAGTMSRSVSTQVLPNDSDIGSTDERSVKFRFPVSGSDEHEGK